MRVRWFRWSDAIPAAIVAAAALGLLIASGTKPQGAFARIDSPSGTQMLSLSENTMLTVRGHGHTLTVSIEDDAVRVTEADCPDRVCVHTGAIARETQTIACVPAGVVITVVGAEGPSVDAVTR